LLKKYGSVLLKIIVALGLFYFLLKDQNMTNISKTMMQIPASSFLLICILYSFIFYFFAHRWAAVNKIFNIDISILRLFKHHLIAFFFSNGLPSTVGGDFWRIKELYSITDTKSKAFFIPIIERFSGFFAVYLLGVLSFVWLAEELNVELYQIFLASFFALLLAVFLLSKKIIQILRSFLKRFSENKIAKRVIELLAVLSLVSEYKAKFIIAILYSILSQLIYACCCFFMIKAMGQHIMFWHALLIVPIVYFVSVMPVSIGGFGLREGTFIMLLPQFGVAESSVVAISFMLTLMQLFVSLVGGLLFLFHKKKV
jgi:hypothetical protein